MTIKFLSLDIDNTLIDEESLTGNFSKFWIHSPQEQRPRLCYNTGRLLDDALNLVKNKVLPPPSFIISGVGTNIYDFKEKKLLKEFSEILEEGWDLALVQRLVDELPFDISKQPLQYQHAYKQSYFLDSASEQDIDYIEKQFLEAELEVNVIYSGNRFLDFLPKWANKGNALNWLLRRLEIPVNQTIVAGDSGNDNTMFTIPEIKGIVVANAQEELLDLTKRINNGSIYHAEKPASDGVVEGLKYFKVLPEEEPVLPPSPEQNVSDEIIEYLDEERTDETEIAEIETVQEGYWKAIEAIRHNITPLGFTACSMEHNPPRGTDANYRSVWARDSAITIIGTLPLIKDKQIRGH